MSSFSKIEVSAKYELAGQDTQIKSPEGYNGLLSDAPLSVVEALVKRKSNLVRLRAVSSPAKTDKPA